MTKESMTSHALLWPVVLLACLFFKGTIQAIVPSVLVVRKYIKKPHFILIENKTQSITFYLSCWLSIELHATPEKNSAQNLTITMK